LHLINIIILLVRTELTMKFRLTCLKRNQLFSDQEKEFEIDQNIVTTNGTGLAINDEVSTYSYCTIQLMYKSVL